MKLKVKVPQVLDCHEMREIFDSALKILKEVPLTADGTEEFNQLVSEFGCKVDNKKIYFPDRVINKLLERIEHQKKRSEDEPEPELPDMIKPHVSGQGALIVDHNDGAIRNCTSKDLCDLARFIDHFNGEVGWLNPTFLPTDKPMTTREIHAFAVICQNHSKPTRVSPYSPLAVEKMYDILKVCLGSDEKVRENWHLIHHKFWINTPFIMGRESIEAGMLSRKLLGHKAGFTMMPVAGAATPITAPGCLALVTAEVLAANILSLALDDYLVGYCSSPLNFDLRIGAHIEADPYTDVLRIGANQMRTFVFGGATYFGAFAPRTSAKVPGVQSVMEKTFGSMWHMFCGGRAFNSVGTLMSGDLASFIQILLDLEITGYLNRILKGLDCAGEDKLCEEINIDVIPTGARFMEHEHTFQHFRSQQWYPQFADRRYANAWKADPKEMVDYAKEKTIEILSNAQNQSDLDNNQINDINEILKEADRKSLNKTG